MARIRLGFVSEPTYTVKALDESTWPAFAALVERNNGIFGGCWCTGFHPEDSRNAAHNRAAKEQRVREGQAHAALVFDGDDCVGWCQFGAPGEVPRIKNRAAYEKGQTTSPDWRIACCYVGKGHRRQGVASAALAGALDLIAGLGGGPSRDTRRTPVRCPPGSCSTAPCRPMRSSGSSGTHDRQAPLGRDQGRRAEVVANAGSDASSCFIHPVQPTVQPRRRTTADSDAPSQSPPTAQMLPGLHHSANL